MSRLLSMLLATLFLAGGTLAGGQSLAGSSLSGTVRDPRGRAVADAVVTLVPRSVATDSQSETTDATGNYRFVALVPGIYDVQVHCPPFSDAHLSVRLPLNGSLLLDLPLAVPSISSRIRVTARAPLVEVGSGAAPAEFTPELLWNLPTTRVLSDIVNLAPGISGDRAFGGTEGGNELLVDGVPLTEPRVGFQAVGFDYNWIQLAQVTATAADPDYRPSTGATLNAVVRDGGNRWSGLGDYLTTRSSWAGDNTGSLPAAERATFSAHPSTAYWETSAQAGGPIKVGAAWLFSGVNLTVRNTEPGTVPGSIHEEAERAVAKVTAVPFAGTRLEALASHGRMGTSHAGLSPEVPLVATYRERQSDSVWNIRIGVPRNAGTTLELQAGGFAHSLADDSMLPGGNTGPAPHYDMVNDRYSANAAGIGHSSSRDTLVRGTVTHYAERFAGVHRMRFGVEYERTAGTQYQSYPTGMLYLDQADQPYLAYIGPAGASFSARRVAVHAQDSWSLVRRITVTPGLRLDVNRGSVPGKGTVLGTSGIAPRLGLAWDVTSSHATTVRLHYGRYFDPLYGAHFDALDTSLPPQVLAAVAGPGAFTTLQVVGREARSVAGSIKQPRVDEWVGGVERQVGYLASVRVQVIDRRFSDFVGIVDLGSRWVPVQRPDPGPDGVPGTADDGGTMQVFKQASPGSRDLSEMNPPGAYRHYRAVQITARVDRPNGLHVLGGYTMAATRGTVSGSFHDNAYLDRLDLGSSSGAGNWVNPNKLINADGPARWSQELKAVATCALPGALHLSAVGQWRTGAGWARTVLFPGLGGGVQRVAVERPSTRRLPAATTLDVRVEKTVRVAGGNVGFFLDVFNALNRGVATAIDAVSGPAFGSILGWSNPRTVRVGARVTR